MHKKLWKKINRLRNPRKPTLRFSPTAWAKLLCLRDLGPTEVGAFGLALTDDPLLVTDVQLVGQTCSLVSVLFDDQAVADFFDAQVDRGLRPAQFGRIWVHTHPWQSPAPSGVDEETFARVFSATDWAVMFILAKEGQTYARLQFHAGPGGGLRMPVRVDYGSAFPASDSQAWEAEYHDCVMALDDVWLDPGAPGEAEPWWHADTPSVIGQVRELSAGQQDQWPAEEPWYAD